MKLKQNIYLVCTKFLFPLRLISFKQSSSQLLPSNFTVSRVKFRANIERIRRPPFTSRIKLSHKSNDVSDVFTSNASKFKIMIQNKRRTTTNDRPANKQHPLSPIPFENNDNCFNEHRELFNAPLSSTQAAFPSRLLLKQSVDRCSNFGNTTSHKVLTPFALILFP